MTSPRSTPKRYNDACGAAHGLELVGDRWALLVLRELMLGPRRFSQLRADLPGISANVLTQRLGELEVRGLLVRRKLAPPAAVQVYELTRWGYEAEEILQVLGRWAARSPMHDATLPISAVSILISFRTMIDRTLAREMDLRVGFRFGEDAYLAHVADGAIDIARGDAGEGDIVLAGQPAGLAAAIYGDVPLDDLAAAGLLTLTGPREAFAAFSALFTLPPKASMPG
jgi:DNA-binding HxlR family transcriptional regulator